MNVIILKHMFKTRRDDFAFARRSHLFFAWVPIRNQTQEVPKLPPCHRPTPPSTRPPTPTPPRVVVRDCAP